MEEKVRGTGHILHPVSAHSVCFCLSAAAGIRLVLLGETGRFCSDLGVSCCDQSTKNTNNNHVSKACPCTLCKYLVGRLCVDHNVKYRRNDHPCSEVGNNLHNVEQHDLFLLESAVLDRIFAAKSPTRIPNTASGNTQLHHTLP